MTRKPPPGAIWLPVREGLSWMGRRRFVYLSDVSPDASGDAWFTEDGAEFWAVIVDRKTAIAYTWRFSNATDRLREYVR